MTMQRHSICCPPCAEQLVLRLGEQLPCGQQPQGCFLADCCPSKQQGWPATAHALHAVFAAQPAAQHTSARKPLHTPALSLRCLHVALLHNLLTLSLAAHLTCQSNKMVLMRHTCFSLVAEPCVTAQSSARQFNLSLSTQALHHTLHGLRLAMRHRLHDRPSLCIS